MSLVRKSTAGKVALMGIIAASTISSNFMGASASAAQAKADDVRTIIAKVPYQTYSGDSVYLTGDSSALCSWKPDCVQMQPLGFDIYQAQIRVASGTSVQLRVTRGSWDSESSSSGQIPMGNTVVNAADPNAPVVIQILGWKDRKATGATQFVKIYPNVYSSQLNNSRTMRILVPETYESNPTKRYPVIYMPDAQNIFDSATANYGSEWDVDETYASLYHAGKIREAIIVGLDANADRLNEYNYNLPQGQAYVDFLIHTVKPWIDQNFRTLSDRENTYSSGSSMGAHLSLSLIWRFPELFSKAAGLSLPGDIANKSLYNIVTKRTFPKYHGEAYMDHGDYSGDAGYPAADDAFMNYFLNQVGFPSSQLVYRNYPYADHFEADWSRRFGVALEYLLGTNKK